MALDSHSPSAESSRLHRVASELRGHVPALLAVLYFLVAAGLLAHYGVGLGAEKLLIVGLVLAALVASRPVPLLRDWVPIILLFLGYEFLRGVAYTHGLGVNVWFMIDADRALFFGGLPGTWLQEHLLDPARLHWWDYAASLLYASHIVVPFAFAFYLWLARREEFKKFAITLLAMSYAGFLTYLLFPAMPPWMAADNGYIPPTQNVVELVLGQAGSGESLPVLYEFIHPNPVAAMPSLHAAFPLLVVLFAFKIFGRRAWPALAYPAAVWFSIVYTGNHYAIDVLAGVAYAVIFFMGFEWWWRFRARAQRTAGDRLAHDS